MMHGERHQVPIWFFIGILLLLYGTIISVCGICLWIVPPEHPVRLAEIHADVWWGALMAAVGAFYTWRYHPSRA